MAEADGGRCWHGDAVDAEDAVGKWNVVELVLDVRVYLKDGIAAVDSVGEALEVVEAEHFPVVLAVEGGVVHGHFAVFAVCHPWELGVVGERVVVFRAAELLPVFGYCLVAPGAHLCSANVGVVGDEEVGGWLELVVDMVFLEFFVPGTIVLLGCPEGVVGWEEQGEEGLAAPVDAAAAAVDLHAGVEGTVEAEGGDVVL